jgi:signal transduction histidine kinase
MISGNLRSSSSMMGTNQEKGSGLGLLLVKDFVTQHGGTTAVDSELGKGTCFRFTLPAVK